MENKEYVMYIVVNKDLNMSRGKTSAQVAHACTTYLLENAYKKISETEKIVPWYEDCQKQIILGAHEKEMNKLAQNEDVYVVHDCGLTEIPEGSLTAICLGVFEKDKVPNKYKRLRLL